MYRHVQLQIITKQKIIIFFSLDETILKQLSIDSCVLGAPTCNINKNSRSVCGWLGIKKTSCQGLGCCYDDRASGWHRCFYPKHVKGKILYHSCFLFLLWYQIKTRLFQHSLKLEFIWHSKFKRNYNIPSLSQPKTYDFRFWNMAEV